ncbi:MAG: alpha/beta hydrolase [Asgard group archaeon]|nr:alpha/beta hydrolase [Asgard group archaeon]
MKNQLVDFEEKKFPDELAIQLTNLLNDNDRQVQYFYDKGVSKVFYIPIDDGALRVFHHKPEKPLTTRPLLFAPGLGTSPWTWRDISKPFIGRGEFFFLETREKKSSLFHNRVKTKITIEKSAKDIGTVIDFLGLTNTDFVLCGTSYCAGLILQGLLDKQFTAPTIALIDPFVKVFQYRILISLIRCTPPFIISLIRNLLGAIALKGEKNATQYERGLDMVKEAVTWKWRKAAEKILKFDIRKYLPQITEEILVFHGTADKHHPHDFYESIARKLPNGRYFYMLPQEDKRELLVGVITYELCKVSSQSDLPESLKAFEVNLEK